MTRPDDPSWGPQDDERVRAALMSLVDDVSAEPLPEPESVRARAEGRGTGEVSDLALRRSRRRSFAVLAAAAAAAVVATSAGLYVSNQSPDRPLATSSTQEDTPTDSSTPAPSRLTMLDARTWAAVLDRPVESTTTDAPDGQVCFEPTDDASWTRGGPELADGSVPAGQWIGTARSDSEPLTEAVDAALQRCEDLTTVNRTRGTLAGGAAYRAWLTADADGTQSWWIEVTDGDGLSFLTVPEPGSDVRSPADIRELAEAVIAEADLTRQTSTSETTDVTSTASATDSTTAPSPTTPLIPPPDATGTSAPASPDNSSSPPSTASSTVASTSASTSPSPDPIDNARFVPAAQWASQSLTGGATTFAGPLSLEGSPPYIEACITSELEGPVATTGIRSGPGDDNYFGRQYIALSSDPDAVRSELLAGYASGACPGRAIGGTSTQLDTGIFRMQQGDLTSYLAVVRMQGQGVSVLDLTEAKTAPEPLTDSVAVAELTRLSELAAAR